MRYNDAVARGITLIKPKGLIRRHHKVFRYVCLCSQDHNQEMLLFSDAYMDKVNKYYTRTNSRTPTLLDGVKSKSYGIECPTKVTSATFESHFGTTVKQLV